MAIANYYVDPDAGDDTTGDGTSGTPWKTVQKALNTITSGANGDRINIKAGAADSLTASLTLGTYGAPTAAKPLVFQGYTTTTGDGGIGEINGDGTYSIFNDAGANYIHWVDLKLGNCGTLYILSTGAYGSYIRCEIHTTSATNAVYIDAYTRIVGCYFHSLTGTNGVLLGGIMSFTDNTVKFDGTGSAVYVNGHTCFIARNIVKLSVVGATAGINGSGGSRNVIIHNSIYTSGASATGSGITLGAEGLGCTVNDNIIQGFSGSGGRAIKSTGGNAPAYVANNLSYNNSNSNLNSWSGDAPLIEVANTVLSASAFTNPASDNFTVNTDAKEAAVHQVFKGAASSTTFMDAGACQREEPAGGGGVIIVEED